LTTPIGAPPPGKEGGVDSAGRASARVQRLGVSRREDPSRGRQSDLFGSRRVLALAFVTSPPGVGTPRGVKLWCGVCHSPAVRSPADSRRPRSGRAWLGSRGSPAYLSQRPNCQKAPALRPGGGVVPGDGGAPRPESGGSSRGIEVSSFVAGLFEAGTRAAVDGSPPGVTDPGHRRKDVGQDLMEGPRRGTARRARLGGRRPTWRGSPATALAAIGGGSIREP